MWNSPWVQNFDDGRTMGTEFCWWTHNGHIFLLTGTGLERNSVDRHVIGIDLCGWYMTGTEFYWWAYDGHIFLFAGTWLEQNSTDRHKILLIATGNRHSGISDTPVLGVVLRLILWYSRGKRHFRFITAIKKECWSSNWSIGGQSKISNYGP